MPEKHAWTRWFWGVMGACALAQLVLAGATAGYAADYNTFGPGLSVWRKRDFPAFMQRIFCRLPARRHSALWPLGKLAQLLHKPRQRVCALPVGGARHFGRGGLAALCYRLAGAPARAALYWSVAAGASPALYM